MKEVACKKALDWGQLLTLRQAAPMWEISENLPGGSSRYVARLFIIGAGNVRTPTKDEINCDNLETLRGQMRGGILDPVPRVPEDPPHVVERWI